MARNSGTGELVAFVYRSGNLWAGPYGTVAAAKGQVTSSVVCNPRYFRPEHFEIRVYDLTKIEPEVI